MNILRISKQLLEDLNLTIHEFLRNMDKSPTFYCNEHRKWAEQYNIEVNEVVHYEESFNEYQVSYEFEFPTEELVTLFLIRFPDRVSLTL